MTIQAELDGRNIPLNVDSGSVGTVILASLLASKSKGPESPRSVDIFGTEIPRGEQMRLVDLKINGQTFRSHPVIPRPTINEKGVVDFGYIGMDILKNRVIYHDGTKHEFILLTWQKGSRHIATERETHTD